MFTYSSLCLSLFRPQLVFCAQMPLWGWILSVDKEGKKLRQYSNPRGHQRVKTPWGRLEYERRKLEGQSSEIRAEGFHSLSSKTQIEHAKFFGGFAKETTTEQLKNLAQHVTPVTPPTQMCPVCWEVNMGGSCWDPRVSIFASFFIW